MDYIILPTTQLSCTIMENFRNSYFDYKSPNTNYTSQLLLIWSQQIQGLSVFEPRHEKTYVLVFDLVRHKQGCTATEDGYSLEISGLESRGIILFM